MSIPKSIRSVSHDLELCLVAIQRSWKDSNAQHFQSKFGLPVKESISSYIRATTKLDEELERAERKL